MKKGRYFTRAEGGLFIGSLALISAAFFLFDGENYLAFTASCIGVTSLVFNAKGNPAGQALMLLFSGLYGVISYGCAYYGEMITYLAMTAPMAAASLVSWLKHLNGNKAEVRANALRKREYAFSLALSLAVTIVFYFILKALSTANLFWSTVSVYTSFFAAYLTFRRSPAFALGYAVNDAVLIVLWAMATAGNRGYLSVLVCFCVFLINDLYGFYNWRRILKRQRAERGERIKERR